MPRRPSKSLLLRRKQEKVAKPKTPSPPPSENDSVDDAVTSSEVVESSGAVEVIHWIPASSGSVIQIPSGQGSEHYSIQVNEDGQVVELPVFQSDMVC